MRLAESRIQPSPTHAELKVKLVRPKSEVADVLPDVGLIVMMSVPRLSQLSPRHCFISTESITRPVDVALVTASLTEQSSVE